MDSNGAGDNRASAMDVSNRKVDTMPQTLHRLAAYALVHVLRIVLTR